MTSLITTSEPLRTRFRGALLRPGEEGYEQARRIWNGAIDRRPALIARCAGADDVPARARASPASATCRSPSAAAATPSSATRVADDGVMIDLSLMKGVAVDPAARTARAARRRALGRARPRDPAARPGHHRRAPSATSASAG